MRELPTGWTVATLDQFGLRIDAGLNVRCEERPPTGEERGLVKISAVTWGRFNQEQSKTLPESAEINERDRIQVGDLLMSRANTIELVGAAVLVTEVHKRLYLSDKVLRLVIPGQCRRWVHYSLKTPESRKAIAEASSGNQLSMRNISQDRIRNLEIPVAPLREQQRIADKLDTVLARVDACRDRLACVAPLLKRFRQSVLASAVCGRLSLDWRAKHPELPSWSMCATREAGRIQLGRQRSPKFHSGNSMRPYLRVQNVFEDRLDLSDVMSMDFPGEDFERYRLHPGDILLNEGQSPEYLGRPAMYRGELPGSCFTNTLIRFQAYEHVSAEFAILVFRNYMHSGRYLSEGTTTTNIAHLGAGRFGDVEFPLPPLAEQEEISRRAGDLLAYADRLEARLTAAQSAIDRLTPALLAKAFRGELVPQDPADEPAAELLKRLHAQTGQGPQHVVPKRGRPAQGASA